MATYTVTNTFTADTTAVASQVNANFTDCLTALNAFDASNLASGTVALARISGLTTTQFAAATLVTEAEGIDSNDNDTTLPTSAAVKDDVDTAVATKDLGAYTNQDDDSATMVAAHAYLTNQDGFVIVDASIAAGVVGNVIGYVDTDTNPASGGTVLGRFYNADISAARKSSFSFPVASGKYFEVTASNATISIYWQPIGTLVKCTDQD